MTPLNFFMDENNLLLINWDVNSGRFSGRAIGMSTVADLVGGGGGGGCGFDWGRPPP